MIKYNRKMKKHKYNQKQIKFYIKFIRRIIKMNR
jgi:hypothetical protein